MTSCSRKKSIRTGLGALLLAASVMGTATAANADDLAYRKSWGNVDQRPSCRHPLTPPTAPPTADPPPPTEPVIVPLPVVTPTTPVEPPAPVETAPAPVVPPVVTPAPPVVTPAACHRNAARRGTRGPGSRPRSRGNADGDADPLAHPDAGAVHGARRHRNAHRTSGDGEVRGPGRSGRCYRQPPGRPGHHRPDPAGPGLRLLPFHRLQKSHRPSPHQVSPDTHAG